MCNLCGTFLSGFFSLFPRSVSKWSNHVVEPTCKIINLKHGHLCKYCLAHVAYPEPNYYIKSWLSMKSLWLKLLPFNKSLHHKVKVSQSIRSTLACLQNANWWTLSTRRNASSKLSCKLLRWPWVLQNVFTFSLIRRLLSFASKRWLSSSRYLCKSNSVVCPANDWVSKKIKKQHVRFLIRIYCSLNPVDRKTIIFLNYSSRRLVLVGMACW